MKFIGKFFLSLLLLLLAVAVIAYFSLQTEGCSSWLSRWLSAHGHHQFSFTRIKHSFSHPAMITLENLRFGHNNQTEILTAKKAELHLALTQFSDPLNFAAITLYQGTFNTTSITSDREWPLLANRLQFNDMSIQTTLAAMNIRAEHVTGGISPWQPASRQTDNPRRFEASAATATVNNVTSSDLFVQGYARNGDLTLTSFGMNMLRGAVTGNARRNAQGEWHIPALHINDIRLQTTQSLTDFLEPLNALPPLQIERFDVTGAKLQGPDWAIMDLALTLKHARVQDGHWQSEEGSLSASASTFIDGHLELNDPIVELGLSPQGINIAQFSSRWANGVLRAAGNWSQQDNSLTLRELMIAGLEYTLPGNWCERWMAPLPTWLNRIEIKKLVASRNLIIDITPDFPFQITALEGQGRDLLLADHRQWGIWSGTLKLNAGEATFNRVDLRYPSLSLTADHDHITISEMSAFTGKGMLEGLATITQAPDRIATLTLQGQKVPVNLITHWGWPSLPEDGDGAIQLKLETSLAAGTPLRSTLKARLSLDTGRAILQQEINDGDVTDLHPNVASPNTVTPAHNE